MDKSKDDAASLQDEVKAASTQSISMSSSTSSSTTSLNEKQNQSLKSRNACAIFRPIGSVFLFIWHWSVPYRSANRKIDPIYAAIWRTSLDEENVRAVLSSAFPTISVNDLPTDEEHIRATIRARLPPTKLEELEEKLDSSIAKQPQRNVSESPEETWEHVPAELRELLAAFNAHHLEQKINILTQEPYHPEAGQGSLCRSSRGVRKTFRMWRLGFAKGVSRLERVAVCIFIPFLAFSACYPDVAAGFLGERSYNQRSIGSRIATLCQLFSLTIFPYHSLWLLFNWSLERLIGAFVGNTTYALAAVVPAIHRAYGTSWFRFTLLGLSMAWQVGVQFTPTIRDYIVRLLTRRQMRRLRNNGDKEAFQWSDIDAAIAHELTTNKTFITQQSQADAAPPDWASVPFRTRTERFIKFTALYPLGRPADQLVGLLKDDLEVIVNTYQDYALTSPTLSSPTTQQDKGHVEPPLPKIILVIFDAMIFAYICYSFWNQPFTFNTTVAYGTVVVLKQAVIAAKKYQTAKSARRLFTNMVAFNILGVFLVSTPVTINRNILDKTENFVALTLAMVVATLFLAEMIAPVLLKVVEGGVRGYESLAKRRRKQASQRTADPKPQS